MKANMKPSASPGSKTTPPLRSTTVLRSTATSRSIAGGLNRTGGFDSIRLDTYHDSSDLKAALRKLEATFAVPDDVADPLAAVSSADTRETRIDNYSGSSRTTAPTSKSDAAISSGTQPTKVTVVLQPRASAKSSIPPSSFAPHSPVPSCKRASGPSPLLQLPPQLLLRCFAFCDLKTLGVLCCVSVRLNVIVEQQGGELWTAAALHRRIPIANTVTPRVELLRALKQQAHARHAEEAFYEDEIARMEERLRARAADVYAQNVDVNHAIATSGCGSTGSAGGAAPPYWLRQQATGLSSKSDISEQGMESGIQSISAQLCAKLRAQIETLEEMKRLCECKVSLQEESLLQQEAQLRQWQTLLDPGVIHSASVSSPAHISGKATTSPLITAVQLEHFERRIARLVLNGGIVTNTTTANMCNEDATVEIPFVFRYGVEDFASLELVLRALGAHAFTDSAGASADGPQNRTTGSNINATGSEGSDNADSARKSSSSAPAAAARDAGKRWRAFQKVCPVNEEYGNVRTFLKTQELRVTTPGGESGQQSISDSSGGARPSTKQTPALLRVSGFVRRVEAMTDSQVLQLWM